jgi:hypothetical protein
MLHEPCPASEAPKPSGWFVLTYHSSRLDRATLTVCCHTVTCAVAYIADLNAGGSTVATTISIARVP